MYSTVALLLVSVIAWETVSGAPVPLRMVDLTHVFDNTTLNWPDVKGFESNETFLEISGSRFQVEEFFSSTHAGTHMDAPCHFVQGRQTVPEIPLERLIAPAAVVDIREKVALNSDYELQTDDLQQWENTTGHPLNDVILLVRSGWSKYWSNRTAYMGNPDNDADNLHFPGVAPSAAQWLVSKRNVYGVGVETLSVDYGPSKKFGTHFALYDKNIYGLENVGSLDQLPVYGATVHVIPMKLGGACGAPTRIVATFPVVIYGSEVAKPTKSTEETLHEVIRFA